MRKAFAIGTWIPAYAGMTGLAVMEGVKMAVAGVFIHLFAIEFTLLSFELEI